METSPQMHRDEVTISKVVTTLLRHEYGIKYSPKNVPCAYLKKYLKLAGHNTAFTDLFINAGEQYAVSHDRLPCIY